MSLLLNGCGGSFNNGSEGDLKEIQKVIKNILPECQLNELNVPDTEVSLGTQESERLSALVSPLLFDYEQINVKKPNGEVDMWKPPKGTRYFNESGDKLFICNSLGTPIDAISDYKDVFGKPLPEKFSCWVPNPDYAQENLESLKVCEQRLDEVTKLGFWIEIRQGKSDQEIQKSITPLAEVNYQYGYGDYPLAFYKNYAITFKASFDDNNLAGIQNIDLVWKKLTTMLNLDLISNYVSNYPETFQQDSQQDLARSSNSGRGMINLGYSKSLSFLSCMDKLVVSELNYSVGACGKLVFETFQADLNTGGCTFLGYWKDSVGNRKIGVVNFCNVYKTGAFIEGQNYEIKVKIDGSTSYLTKLGYENNVLSFSAV